VITFGNSSTNISRIIGEAIFSFFDLSNKICFFQYHFPHYFALLFMAKRQKSFKARVKALQVRKAKQAPDSRKKMKKDASVPNFGAFKQV
jgi:hypothetical protein